MEWTNSLRRLYLERTWAPTTAPIYFRAEGMARYLARCGLGEIQDQA